MKPRKTSDVVLGVSVTQQLVSAVLLQQVDDHVQIVRRFVRQRSESDEYSSKQNLAKALPGLMGDDSDYSIDIGGGNGHGGGDVTFLASEFGASGHKKHELSAASATAAGAATRRLFTPQLVEILDECKRAGYHAPRVIFCAAPPDVNYIEIGGESSRDALRSTDGGKDGKKDVRILGGGTRRKGLLDRLSEQHSGAFDRDRVAFLPMAPVGGRARYLAIVPEPSEPVSATLAAFQAQHRPLPPFRLMEAEVSVFARLARQNIPQDRPDQNTALVRIGSEDTMILFFTGRDLRHYERLRSLSSYDAPETICSRVMLQQDEQKIGEIHHVLVVSEGREEQILNVFRRMFADAAVETVGDVLESMGVHTPRDADRIPPGSLPAVVAALRVLEDWDKDDSDFAFQLLPKKMQRESKTLVFAWHTLAAMLILVVVAFAFSWRYMDQQTEIERMREEMRQNPVVLPVDNPALLKARVDSLQAAYMMYTQALNVIDSLLVGSDRWTRMHERVTRSTSDIGGVWISSMEPIGSRSIRVKGTATTRTKVAQFARHHQGSIERVSSNEVKHESRNLTLYDFTVTAPVAHETPRVALYLQDVSAGHIQDTAVDSVLAAYEARNLYAPGHAPVEASSNR